MNYQLSNQLKAANHLGKNDVPDGDVDAFLQEFKCPASELETFFRNSRAVYLSYKIHFGTEVGGDPRARGVAATRRDDNGYPGFAASFGQITSHSTSIIYSEWNSRNNTFGESTGTFNLEEYAKKLGPDGGEVGC